MAIKIKPADTWFSKCVRHAAGWQCEKCHAQHEEGSTGLHTSHIFSRRHRTIRWARDNVQALCFSCHSWYGGNPADSGVWIRNVKGDGFIDLLREKKDSGVKISKIEEKEIAKHYREEYKRMIEEDSKDFVSWQ